ncbi:MAG: hypothetical protein BZY88_03715 [SAR202 cluster bacterium Io17-Chloro-G9]|nr:MAG: hypothetical protein BZY88_03715 [SAR202 cluster bacterium Io17-Chloro-G9]
MTTGDESGLDEDVAEVRRRIDALTLDMQGLGLDIRVSIEAYGPESNPEGGISRTLTCSFTVWDREN